MRQCSWMFIVERIINIVAPHYCIMCGDEGAVVCDWCLPDIAPSLPSRCYLCKVATRESQVCSKCRRNSSLRHVWTRAQYEGYAKQLVHDLKFERKQAAAEPVAQLMAEPLPFLPKETIIVHVPTATSRVRRRGYDQAEKISRSLAQQLHLRNQTLLIRITQSRQVGARRSQRISQMRDAFMAVRSDMVQNASILLVDDLTTTGATLEAAARELKSAGAKTVSAVVFAQK